MGRWRSGVCWHVESDRAECCVGVPYSVDAPGCAMCHPVPVPVTVPLTASTYMYGTCTLLELVAMPISNEIRCSNDFHASFAGSKDKGSWAVGQVEPLCCFGPALSSGKTEKGFNSHRGRLGSRLQISQAGCKQKIRLATWSRAAKDTCIWPRLKRARQEFHHATAAEC